MVVVVAVKGGKEGRGGGAGKIFWSVWSVLQIVLKIYSYQIQNYMLRWINLFNWKDMKL